MKEIIANAIVESNNHTSTLEFRFSFDEYLILIIVMDLTFSSKQRELNRCCYVDTCVMMSCFWAHPSLPCLRRIETPQQINNSLRTYSAESRGQLFFFLL